MKKTVPNNGYTVIARDDKMQETIHHGNKEFPFAYYYEDVWEFDLHHIDWHWHPEVEFVYSASGDIDIMVGNEHFVLKEGCGLFINSCVIHYFESDGHVIMPNIVFSPILLAPEESLVYRKYIAPVLKSGMKYLVFSPKIPWQKEIIDALMRVFSLQENEEKNEIQTVRYLMEIWELMQQNMPAVEEKARLLSSVKQAQLQIMMQYIQKNYEQPISLEEIASSAMISKSTALKLFASTLHISPVAYLLRYRLQQAADLLSHSEKTTAEIAQEAGFYDSAYFCRKFKELYNKTPGRYRKDHLKQEEKS